MNVKQFVVFLEIFFKNWDLKEKIGNKKCSSGRTVKRGNELVSFLKWRVWTRTCSFWTQRSRTNFFFLKEIPKQCLEITLIWCACSGLNEATEHPKPEQLSYERNVAL